MVIQASVGIIYAVMAAQAAGTRLVSPLGAAPPTWPFSRTASVHGVAALAKRSPMGQAKTPEGTHEPDRGGLSGTPM